MARATKEQLETRKENALTALEQCTDSYRTFYAKIVGITDPDNATLFDLKHKKELIDFKCSVIKKQIELLDELIRTYDEQ